MLSADWGSFKAHGSEAKCTVRVARNHTAELGGTGLGGSSVLQ